MPSGSSSRGSFTPAASIATMRLAISRRRCGSSVLLACSNRFRIAELSYRRAIPPMPPAAAMAVRNPSNPPPNAPIPPTAAVGKNVCAPVVGKAPASPARRVAFNTRVKPCNRVSSSPLKKTPMDWPNFLISFANRVGDTTSSPAPVALAAARAIIAWRATARPCGDRLRYKAATSLGLLLNSKLWTTSGVASPVFSTRLSDCFCSSFASSESRLLATVHLS